MNVTTANPQRRHRSSWAPVLAIASAVLLYLAVAPTGVSKAPTPSLAFDDINPRMPA